MAHPVKTWLISLLVRVLGILTSADSPVSRAAKKAAQPFLALARGVFRYVVVPVYGLGFYAKRTLRRVVLPAKNQFMFVVANRYVVHGLIVAVTIVTSVASVHAREVRAEHLGEQSLLYKLVTGDEDEIIEETALPEGPQTLSYFDPAAVTDELGTDDINIVDESDTNVSGGGTAVVQPTMTDPHTTPSGQRTTTEVYVVQDGDTLSTIASRFGVTINTILWENKMTPRDFIRPGDKLTILPVSGISYAVKKGDTLGAIARKYAVSEDSIVTANRLASAADLRIGESLVLPGAVPPSVPVAAAPRRVPAVTQVFSPDRGGTAPPSKSPTAATRMVWPTDMRVITQYFSWRHSGLDIDGHYQNGIYASEAGVVTHAGWGRTKGGYGYYVDIDHGGGIMTRYAHASKIFVGVGDQVTKGMTIAMVGTTGRSTGTHLHFEVRVNGRVTNPLDWTR